MWAFCCPMSRSYFLSLMAYDADGSREAILVDSGIRPIHISADCVDGALQVGSEADARAKPFWHEELWLCLVIYALFSLGL